MGSVTAWDTSGLALYGGTYQLMHQEAYLFGALSRWAGFPAVQDPNIILAHSPYTSGLMSLQSDIIHLIGFTCRGSTPNESLAMT